MLVVLFAGTETALHFLRLSTSSIIQRLAEILIIHSGMATTHQFAAGLESKTTAKIEEEVDEVMRERGKKKKRQAGKKGERERERGSHKDNNVSVKC